MRYNSRAPYIIGEEWVPIRQANYLPSQEEERGYTFTIDHAAEIVSGAFYVQEQPSITVVNQVELISVYPGDTEDLTGPLQQIVIPASGISVTGVVVGALSGLLNPSDANDVELFAGGAFGNSSELGVNFDVSAYQNALQGKRIVNVKLLYTVRNSTFPNSDPSTYTFVKLLRATDVANFIVYGGIDIDTTKILSTDFDSVNVFWTSGVTALTEPRAYPWRWEELNLLDETAPPATKLQIVFTLEGGVPEPENQVAIGYAALQVTFCEERRTLYGGWRAPQVGTLLMGYQLGPSLVQLRTTGFAIPGSAAAGGYFVSHSHRQIAESRFSFNRQPPVLYGLRQLHEIPTMQSKIIDIDKDVGEEFTSQVTDIVPYITLHHTGAIVTGSHAYGQQVAAPVYGSITAVQAVNGLLGATGASNGPFTQVRFYARRFGSSSGTLILRQGATTQASITEEELDALPEIVDGWREVTLDLDNDITFTGTDVNYTWEALGVAAGSRWEVLGADGPALSGNHANRFASYEPPAQGNVLELFWKNVNQLTTTEDDDADGVLIFSQDPPAVTGFTVVGSGCTVAVTGIGAECTLPDVCIPTAVHGNALSWQTGVLCDTFSREVSGSWGTPDTGPTSSTSGGTAANYLVSGGKGILYFPNNNLALNVIYPIAIADGVSRGTLQLSGQPTGTNVELSVTARYTDGTHFVQARIFALDTGGVTIHLRYFDGGGEVGTGFVSVQNLTATTRMSWNFEYVGTTLRFRVWPANEPEPIGVWHLTFTTTLVSAGQAIIDATVSSSVTGPFPLQIEYDNLSSIPFALDGGTVEVQRSDDLTDWQTIATVSPCVTGMCDMEARVGMESRYRIRTCNSLEFCGPWVTGAGTLAAPGIAGAGDGDGVLIFTSNRAPLSSLAYAMSFDRDTDQEFAFPEGGGFTRLEPHFGRDFFTAFRPLERGGEQFSRAVLVNAMAIPPQSLADMNDLRDLAWEDLPYVCVRDSLGNRWFANVQVPSGTVRRRRTLYYARIDVTEVTATAAPLEGGGVE